MLMNVIPAMKLVKLAMELLRQIAILVPMDYIQKVVLAGMCVAQGCTQIRKPRHVNPATTNVLFVLAQQQTTAHSALQEMF